MRAALMRAYLALRHQPLLRYLARIEESQWLSREAILTLQTRKLGDLLRHAQKTVPYYREVFQRAGFSPGSLQSPGELSALPILERDTVVERFDELRAEAARDAPVLRATGGSTGRPVRFLVDERERTARSAHLYRHLRWLGWDLGGRCAYVWGSDVDSREHRGLRAALRDAFVGVLWLDAFTLESKRLDEYLDRLERYDPDVLIGYPSSLHLLAERALATSRRVRLRGIQTSAEILAPRVRRDLESAFGAPVRDRYGCREAGIIAHECPAGRLHINAESVYVECIDGQLLLTTLNNYTMPLIRYRNEDLAQMADESCSCGRGLPLLRVVSGRLSDVIRSPGGHLIHGEFFTHLFYDAPGIRRFQVRQTRLDELEIRVVADEAFTPEARQVLDRHIHNADRAFQIKWIPVAEIPAGLSGKFRFTISDLGGDPSPS